MNFIIARALIVDRYAEGIVEYKLRTAESAEEKTVEAAKADAVQYIRDNI